MSENHRRILMVCMGNICRSPTAEAVLRAKLKQARLDDCVTVDSAGTHAYHVGEPPDVRSQKHGHRRGYDLSTLRARKVVHEDFEHFDVILAMDHDNMENLIDICPIEHRGKIELLMSYSPSAPKRIVPDPYYGAAEGFDEVIDLIEKACDGLIATLKK